MTANVPFKIKRQFGPDLDPYWEMCTRPGGTRMRRSSWHLPCNAPVGYPHCLLLCSTVYTPAASTCVRSASVRVKSLSHQLEASALASAMYVMPPMEPFTEEWADPKCRHAPSGTSSGFSNGTVRGSTSKVPVRWPHC